MQCNIDKKGRVARAGGGAVCMGVGIVFLLTGFPATPWLRWTLSIVLMVAGLFQWYEARKGWCAVRAMGIKTWI